MSAKVTTKPLLCLRCHAEPVTPPRFMCAACWTPEARRRWIVEATDAVRETIAGNGWKIRRLKVCDSGSVYIHATPPPAFKAARPVLIRVSDHTHTRNPSTKPDHGKRWPTPDLDVTYREPGHRVWAERLGSLLRSRVAESGVFA